MYKVNDYVVYKRNVCKIKEVKNNLYVLNPIDDESLIITISKDNNSIRNIITKEESLNLINSIPNIDIIKANDKLIENEYKNLLNSGRLEEKLLYNELSISLNLSYEDTKKYIKESVEQLINEK